MLARLSALIVLVLAVVAAWILSHPLALPSTKTVRVQDEDWKLPRRESADIDALVQAIEANKLWGAGNPLLPSQAEEKALTAPNWRITGVVAAGKEHVALLSVEEQPMQQLKIGDALPGGAKILDISPDKICILLNGKKRFLKTYKE